MSTSEFPQKDYSFLARYGATILRGGITAIPTALYRYQGQLKLSPQHVWFISAILARKWDADLPYPSLRKMAEETGVSEQQLHNYKKQLVADGWLRILNRRTRLGGKDTNFYDFSPLFHALEELLRRDQPGGGEAGYRNPGYDTHHNHRLDTHHNAGLEQFEEALEEESVLQESVNSISNGDAITGQIVENCAAPGQTDLPSTPTVRHAPGRRTKKPQDAPTRMAPGRDTHALPPDYCPPQAPTGFSAVGQVLAQLRELPGIGAPPSTRRTPARRNDTADEPPPRPPARGTQDGRGPARGTTPRVKPTPYIAAVMTDLSRQLNDDEHTRSNITRAMRLFHASGIADEAAFVQRLYEARSITRSQGGIKKPASIGGGLINRMPYFFGVLEDVLGFKTGAARRLVPQGGGLHHA